MKDIVRSLAAFKATDKVGGSLLDGIDSSITNNSEVLNKLASYSLAQQTELDGLLKLVPESEKPEIEQTLSITRRSIIIAEVATINPEYLSENPSVLDEDVEDGYFKVLGNVYENDRNHLNIGGVDINNIFPFEGSIYPGTLVEVKGLVKSNGTFISKIVSIDQQRDVFELEGVFNGISQDGLFWDVGGLSVIAPLNVLSPAIGSEVILQGVVINGKATISIVAIENEEDEQENEPRYNDETEFDDEASESESGMYENNDSDDEAVERQDYDSEHRSDDRSS